MVSSSSEYDTNKQTNNEQVLFQQDSNNNLTEQEKIQAKKKYNFNEAEIEDGTSKEKNISNSKSNGNFFSTHYKTVKKYAELIGENLYFNFFMVVITLWTLYQEDIRLAVVPKSGDTAFTIIASIIFFLYIFEIIVLLIYKDDYFNFTSSENNKDDDFFKYVQSFFLIGSFYFWADVLSTAILIFDIPWIIGDLGMKLSLSLTYELGVANAVRIGIRFLKVIRFIRMIRIFSVSSVYQTLMSSMGYMVGSEIQEEKIIEETNKDDRLQSRVGAAMAEILSRRVLLLIIIMIILIPILLSVDEDTSLILAARMLNDMNVLNQIDPATYSSGLALTIEIIMEKLPVIFIQLNNEVLFQDHKKTKELRSIETVNFELETSESQFYVNTIPNTYTIIEFDQKYLSVQSATYSLYTTTFLIVVFGLAIYFFSIDLQMMVIQPIEKLVALVEKISENPLGVEYNKMMGKKDGFYEGMETTVLLSTINKIGQLMRVGFGEAGAPIIAKNLSESSGGTLNLMGSGTLINSIFGFCDVRQFTDTTECLQEEVMLFVNRIAHILHSITVQCSGSANKNIGDAFLLTWKLDDKLTTEQASFLADQALLTFLKALVELCRHHNFICNFTENATQRLMKRFPGYTVRIGAGLHVGWAIEGAVGSNRKIDATYLSPHVSATEYLESSTKAYGVSLLMSEPFYKLLSPEANKHCRQVDRVRRSALEMPIGLYTYDADLTIDWNDKTRYNLKDARSRLQAAGRNRNNRESHPTQPVETVNSIINRPYSMDIHASIHPSIPTAPAVVSGQLNNNFPAHSLVASSSHSSTVDNLDNPNIPKKKRSVNKDSRRQSTFNFKSMLNNNNSSIHPIDDEDEEEEKKKAETAPTIMVQPYTRDTWVEDKDVIDLRHLTSNENFRSVWEDGINSYINGDWERARDCFTTTLQLTDNKDGPSKYLLSYMTQFEAEGKHWPGYKDEASDE